MSKQYKHADSITRCINDVVQRANDYALLRRPLKQYRPSTLSTRRLAPDEKADDDDMDYEDPSPDYLPPGADRAKLQSDDTETKKRKAAPLSARNGDDDSSPTTRLSKRRKVTAVESPPKQTPNLWGEHVPIDVLHHIFDFALRTEQTAPFLTRMQKVCRQWRQAAIAPHLWAAVDLECLKDREPSVVLGGLQKYAGSVRVLSFARWVKVTVGQIAEFLSATKELRSLNVEFCRGLDLRQLLCVLIPEYCPKLNSLDLSYVDPIGHKRLTSILREFLSLEIGHRLEYVYLNGNALSDLRRLCAESARSRATENVRVLHLSRVCMSSGTSHKIRLVDFVQSFPNLRILHMADAMLDFTCTTEEENNYLQNGWPYLTECNIATSSDWHRYTEVYDVLIRLLGRCKNLRRLDLSGFCVRDSLIWLREIPLTHLNLSRVRGIARNAVSMDFFSTWGRSLEMLSIAWVVGYVDSLCALFAQAKQHGCAPKLIRLDLTGTCVTATQLSILLDVCQSLQFVDVQSCRGMPLGMKRAYDGPQELSALRNKLKVTAGEMRIHSSQ